MGDLLKHSIKQAVIITSLIFRINVFLGELHLNYMFPTRAVLQNQLALKGAAHNFLRAAA